MLKASRGSYVNLGGYIRDDDDLVHSDEPAGAPVPQKVCLGRILEGLQGDSSRPGTPEKIEDDSSVKLSTKDLKAMGLAAGGKLGGYFPNPFALRQGSTHHICPRIPSW